MSESAVVNPSAPALGESNIWVIPGFREFMTSMVLVTLANQIQGTVVAYQIYELTRDPLSLGAVGLAAGAYFVLSDRNHVGVSVGPQRVALVGSFR